jgi:hypothetical protein
MEDPKIKTKVVHSQSKSAWNVIGTTLCGKFKIARVPYIKCNDSEATDINNLEALKHAEFISWCFNNSDKILSHENHI